MGIFVCPSSGVSWACKTLLNDLIRSAGIARHQVQSPQSVCGSDRYPPAANPPRFSRWCLLLLMHGFQQRKRRDSMACEVRSKFCKLSLWTEIFILVTQRWWLPKRTAHGSVLRYELWWKSMTKEVRHFRKNRTLTKFIYLISGVRRRFTNPLEIQWEISCHLGNPSHHLSIGAFQSSHVAAR